jgi:hypothetical protein
MRSALLLLPLVFLVACGRVCAGPDQLPPGIYLDAEPWFAVHPDDRLTACVDGRCRDVVAADARPIVQLLIPAGTDPSATMTLTVADGSGLKLRRDFTPVHTAEDGPCGRISQWTTPATLTGGGQLLAG